MECYCHMPPTVQGGLGHGNTYFVMLLLTVTSHVPLYSEQPALYEHAWGSAHADVYCGDLHL